MPHEQRERPMPNGRAKLRDDPRHLIRMARNPFLWMLVEVYRIGREIPSSRIRLFKTFYEESGRKGEPAMDGSARAGYSELREAKTGLASLGVTPAGSIVGAGYGRANADP